MGKYIDSEKLKTEIERRRKFHDDAIIKFCNNRTIALTHSAGLKEDEEIVELIDSLQQEQPECSGSLVDVDAVREDFMTEVYRVLDADPTNDRANAIINAFDSLPTVSQRPKVDLVAELKHHLDTTPKEQLEKEWKELEPWGNIGPTVQEFLYGKQPEVDLDEEIYFWLEGGGLIYPMSNKEKNNIKDTAHHFYELGQREMRYRITNPEYNAKVVEQLKSEYPTIKKE